MLGYLSLDIMHSSKLTVFLKPRSRKPVRFSEQIMSTDKYPSIFLCQMEAIVYILQNNAISRDSIQQRSKFYSLYAPTERLVWLSRQRLVAPEVTLGFLEKDLLPPEDSSFSLGIQLGTYIYFILTEIFGQNQSHEKLIWKFFHPITIANQLSHTWEKPFYPIRNRLSE